MKTSLLHHINLLLASLIALLCFGNTACKRAPQEDIEEKYGIPAVEEEPAEEGEIEPMPARKYGTPPVRRFR